MRLTSIVASPKSASSVLLVREAAAAAEEEQQPSPLEVAEQKNFQEIS